MEEYMNDVVIAAALRTAVGKFNGSLAKVPAADLGAQIIKALLVRSAAKAGMHGFTKALALEVVRKGVTVNTISPGYIGTAMVMAIPKDVLESKIIPQIPMGRLGKPEEVAGLVAYLASEEAAFVTGANIAINGGQHMQ
jgi:NAD(P)-dependent dehydrogenase (short-subunit alcohol dehydrogenase family)